MKVHHVPEDGPPLAGEADALDLIGLAHEAGADVVAVPVSRFAPVMWQLRTGLLGGFVQKFVNYGYRLAIIGDLSAFTATSRPLADFVLESNRRRRELVFARDGAELAQRLEG